MIARGDKEIGLMYYAGKAVSAVYYGTRLVWQAVRSCFGKGWWVSGKPWLGNDGWKD